MRVKPFLFFKKDKTGTEIIKKILMIYKVKTYHQIKSNITYGEYAVLLFTFYIYGVNIYEKKFLLSL